MAKRKISQSQIICMAMLWALLCYMLFTYSKTINFYTFFVVICSGILIFVPIYKSLKSDK